MFGVVRFGWVDRYHGGRPIFSLFALFIPLITAFMARRWLVKDNLAQQWLVGLQLFRVIGAVFLIEMLRGNITEVFAYPAGWGDIFAGVTALIVLLVGFVKGKMPEKVILAVAVVGIIDFISAFSIGFFSSKGPWQLLSLDMPNKVYLSPTGLIPFYLVPYASIYHILSLTQYFKDRQGNFKKYSDSKT